MDCSPALKSETLGSRALLGPALAALAVAAGLLATSPATPMVWDEGPAIRRAEGIARWCRRWTSAADAAGPRVSPLRAAGHHGRFGASQRRSKGIQLSTLR